MRRKVVPTLCILCLVLLCNIHLAAQPLEVKPIENLLKDGKREEALLVIESFLTHLPTESDLLYLKGLALPHEVLSLEKAIQYNTWKNYKETDARLLLAERYLRRRLFPEALSVLQGMEASGKSLPEYGHLLARIQFGQGMREEAFRTLRKAMVSFPQDPRFLTLYFRHRDFVTPEDTSLWELIDPKDPHFLEALAEYLCILPDGDQRNTLLQEYLRLGGKDPRVFVPRAGIKDEEFDAQWSKVKEAGGFSRIDIWEKAFSRFTTGKIRERLLEDIRRYSGQMGRDAELDGYEEEVRRLVEGNLTYLAVDSDQDGQWDLVIDFLAQKPYRMQVTRREEKIQIFFVDYPRIDRILVQQEGSQREYRYGVPPFLWKEGPLHLEDGKLPRSLEPVRMETLEPFLTFAFQEAKPYERIETCLLCKRVRKYLYQEGRILSFQEEQEIRPGETRKRTVTFREGSPVMGFVDLDGDGVYDVRESYVKGVLESIELLAGNRTAYREFLSKELKEWDFNGDGKIDAREYSAGRGRKVVEFSSLLDSIFDARAWMESR